MFFGGERLHEVLRAGCAPDRLPQEVLRVVEEYSEGRLTDDLAVLCVSPTAVR